MNMILICEIKEEDAPIISAAFTNQGWNKPVSQYVQYWQESQSGKRHVLVAEYGGEFAGYLTVVWQTNYPPFREASIPEIKDFNVLKKFQRRGIGTALMDEAEKHISQRSERVGIGVGLTPDYGNAQILYIKRGYIPDGKGAYYQDKWVNDGDQVTIDHDLTFYLTKELRNTKD